MCLQPWDFIDVWGSDLMLSLTWDQEWQLGRHILLGRGGAGRTSPSSVVLYVEDAFLSEHIRTISHPFQTGRVFFPLVPNDIDTESNYMSDHPLYSCFPFLLTLKNVCLFLQTKKKGVHIFLLRYSPPSASPLFFQKDKSFWQRNRWTSTKALVFIFSFLSNLNCCCLQSLLWIE